jgi:hypothetical protein
MVFFVFFFRLLIIWRGYAIKQVNYGCNFSIIINVTFCCNVMFKTDSRAH